MCDLCRLIFGLVVDLFRSRAALEAEVLVLKQQITVLRRASQVDCHFLPSTRSFWVGPVAFFRAPMSHSPLLSRILLFDGTVQVSDCFGAGSRGVVWAVRQPGDKSSGSALPHTQRRNGFPTN
jgi:hypothetical protein